MKWDSFLLIFVWILGIALIFVIPKDKKRIAIVVFLFKQFITLLLGLIVVEFNLLSYPVRFFSEVNRASFTYEYFIYPVCCSVFNVYYPNTRSYLFKLGYYAAFCTVLTIPEVMIEHHTNLIKYIHWNWYWTWSSLFITFFLSRLFCKWFFKGLAKKM